MSTNQEPSVPTTIQFDWGKATPDPEFEGILETSVNSNPALAGKIKSARVKGGVHMSIKDRKLRASMQLFDDKGTRVTSAHAYADGQVTLSVPAYQKVADERKKAAAAKKAAEEAAKKALAEAKAKEAQAGETSK